MTNAARKVLEDALALPAEERAQLFLELQDSLYGEASWLTPELDSKIQKALDSVAAGQGISMTEFRRRVATWRAG